MIRIILTGQASLIIISTIIILTLKIGETKWQQILQQETAEGKEQFGTDHKFIIQKMTSGQKETATLADLWIKNPTTSHLKVLGKKGRSAKNKERELLDSLSFVLNKLDN